MNIKKFLKKRGRGQGLVEYALILVLVAIVVLAILLILGPQIGSVFSNVVANFERIGLGGGGGGISFTVLPNGGVYKVTVTVSQSTTVSVSATNATVSPGSRSCNPPGCDFLLNPSGGSGTVTVSGGGASVTRNWP